MKKKIFSILLLETRNMQRDMMRLDKKSWLEYIETNKFCLACTNNVLDKYLLEEYNILEDKLSLSKILGGVVKYIDKVSALEAVPIEWDPLVQNFNFNFNYYKQVAPGSE